MKSNKATNVARQVLTTRLGYIISLKAAKGMTLKEIAANAGVGSSAISLLKNRHWNKISLNYILNVADGLGLEYVLTIANQKGNKVTKVSMPSYDNDPVIRETLKLKVV